MDWAGEVGAWESQRGEIHAAITAALDRGVDPGMLDVYLPALASQARTVRYLLTGLSPDRLPAGATLESLGLAGHPRRHTEPVEQCRYHRERSAVSCGECLADLKGMYGPGVDPSPYGHPADMLDALDLAPRPGGPGSTKAVQVSADIRANLRQKQKTHGGAPKAAA